MRENIEVTVKFCPGGCESNPGAYQINHSTGKPLLKASVKANRKGSGKVTPVLNYHYVPTSIIIIYLQEHGDSSYHLNQIYPKYATKVWQLTVVN